MGDDATSETDENNEAAEKNEEDELGVKTVVDAIQKKITSLKGGASQKDQIKENNAVPNFANVRSTVKQIMQGNAPAAGRGKSGTGVLNDSM